MKTTRLILLVFIVMVLGIRSKAQICVGTQGQIQWDCWQNLYEDSFNELTARPEYPKHPSVNKTIYKTQAPDNYGDYIGARMRGFLKVPTTQTVTFNITGNDKVRFFLSTNDQPQNKQLVAYMDDYSEIAEYTKYPTQTTSSIQLLANQYYYFEIIYAESTGNDHCRLHWKTNLVDPLNWNVISAAYIYDIGCEPATCPPMFTPCNDGDGSTVEDMEDGNCHCVGRVTNQPNACIGTRYQVKKYRYDNIVGSSFNELYASSKFPAMPDYSEDMEYVGHQSRSTENNSGSLVQTYITVPISGNYKFLITSDDNGIAFLSSDSDPENKQAHQFLVTGYTYLNEYDKYIYQKTSNIYLEAGKFYYLEINHKSGTGSSHFGVFWQTPFTESGVWKRISKFYAYNYGCDIACIGQGTPCNDGNPFTNNDVYDNNCNCGGTPCTGPDCISPIANYVPYAKCGHSDQLDARVEHNFLSCTKTQNPNPSRGSTHWVSYDLGMEYKLLKTQIWNYNVIGQTNQGFSNVIVDYSLDGTSWTQLGNYNWPLAPGDVNYSGFSGPDFQGIKARYIIITSNNNSTACKGFGKVVFEAVTCPSAGTPCNDGNAQTVADAFDANCNCQGVSQAQNLCDNINLLLGDTLLTTNNFSAKQLMESVSQIDPNSTVSFYSGESITLNPGFETEGNPVFWATIDLCQQQILANTQERSKLSTLRSKEGNIVDQLVINRIEETGDVMVSFYISKPGKSKLELKAPAFEKPIFLVDHEFENAGWYSKVFKTKRLGKGAIFLKLTTSNGSLDKSENLE